MDRDFLDRRAQELDLGRYELLMAAQRLLDGKYPDQARALSFNDGILKVITPNSAVAQELRLGQVEIMQNLNQNSTGQIKRLQIQIRSLN